MEAIICFLKNVTNIWKHSVVNVYYSSCRQSLIESSRESSWEVEVSSSLFWSTTFPLSIFLFEAMFFDTHGISIDSVEIRLIVIPFFSLRHPHLLWQKRKISFVHFFNENYFRENAPKINFWWDVCWQNHMWVWTKKGAVCNTILLLEYNWYFHNLRLITSKCVSPCDFPVIFSLKIF